METEGLIYRDCLKCNSRALHEGDICLKCEECNKALREAIGMIKTRLWHSAPENVAGLEAAIAMLKDLIK